MWYTWLCGFDFAFDGSFCEVVVILTAWCAQVCLGLPSVGLLVFWFVIVRLCVFYGFCSFADLVFPC